MSPWSAGCTAAVITAGLFLLICVIAKAVFRWCSTRTLRRLLLLPSEFAAKDLRIETRRERMEHGLDVVAAGIGGEGLPLWVGVTSAVAARRAGRRGLGLLISGAFAKDVVELSRELQRIEGRSWTISERGYRGPAFEAQKPEGRIRILVYGGSAVFDVEIPGDDDWPQQVGRLLRERGIDAAEFWQNVFYDNMATNYEDVRDTNPVDLLTSGIFAAHFVNVVSPTFLEEIVAGRHDFIEPPIRRELTNKCEAECATGILNAPDPAFNPETDKNIVKNYSPNDYVDGKKENKRFIQKKLGLIQDDQAPIFFWPRRMRTRCDAGRSRHRRPRRDS